MLQDSANMSVQRVDHQADGEVGLRVFELGSSSQGCSIGGDIEVCIRKGEQKASSAPKKC